MEKRKATPTRGLTKQEPGAKPEDDRAARALAVEVLEHIARLQRRSTLELVIEMGDYVREKLYGGDLRLAASHNPTKPVALGYLEQLAPEHGISVASIRLAVAMATQYHGLPSAVRDRLTARQHRALLPVKDAKARLSLARQAISGKLSGAKLSELARREVGPARTGRKALSDVERAVNAARRALVSAVLEAALEPARVKALPPDERSRIAQHVKTLRERLERISDAVQGVR